MVKTNLLEIVKKNVICENADFGYYKNHYIITKLQFMDDLQMFIDVYDFDVIVENINNKKWIVLLENKAYYIVENMKGRM